MRSTTTRPAAAALTVLALLLGACSDAGEEVKHQIVEPVTISEVGEGEFARLTLTERALRRLDIRTVVVEEVDGRRVIPAGAVITDADGLRAVYTNPEPRVYVRQKVTVDLEDGGRAHLSEGPPAGSRIVTIGAAELHGAETGIGK